MMVIAMSMEIVIYVDGDDGGGDDDDGDEWNIRHDPGWNWYIVAAPVNRLNKQSGGFLGGGEVEQKIHMGWEVINEIIQEERADDFIWGDWIKSSFWNIDWPFFISSSFV